MQRMKVHLFTFKYLFVKNHGGAPLRVVDQPKRRHRPGRQRQHLLQQVRPGKRETGCTQRLLDPPEVGAFVGWHDDQPDAALSALDK